MIFQSFHLENMKYLIKMSIINQIDLIIINTLNPSTFAKINYMSQNEINRAIYHPFQKLEL